MTSVCEWNNAMQYNRKTTSGLQIYRKRYDVHNNIAYTMTKL